MPSVVRVGSGVPPMKMGIFQGNVVLPANQSNRIHSATVSPSTTNQDQGVGRISSQEYFRQLQANVKGKRGEVNVRTQQKALELSKEPSYMQVARGLTPKTVLEAKQRQHFGFRNQYRIRTNG